MPITRQETRLLKTIADISPRLTAFILALRLSLSRPQLQHATQVADALITAEGSKTLSALYRHIVGDPCPKSAADTFREAPWEADGIRISLLGSWCEAPSTWPRRRMHLAPSS